MRAVWPSARVWSGPQRPTIYLDLTKLVETVLDRAASFVQTWGCLAGGVHPLGIVVPCGNEWSDLKPARALGIAVLRDVHRGAAGH